MEIEQTDRFCCLQLILVVFLLVAFTPSDCYDNLDPNGNITVTFDIVQWTDDGYVVRVTMKNYYQYRHVAEPGWKLGWIWAKNEIIWSMSGAVATQQGDCSSFQFQTPHCCKKDPLIVDLRPDLAPQNWSDNCCHGGLLAGWAIEPSKSFSSFEMKVGNLVGNISTAHAPLNLTLLAPGPGYTCSPVEETEPTVSLVIGGIREEQVFRTWKSTCTYSSFLANKTPVCCVSLSTFYNPSVTPCRTCSCGCKVSGQTNSNSLCVSAGTPVPNLVTGTGLVQCTDHMCPLRVHWHIKTNYLDHWRVKLTVSNYNYRKNYSNWNVLVQHPGFSQPTTIYSFNSTMLSTFGASDEIALLWGLEFYNGELKEADENEIGSVSTEILLQKDKKSFTLRNGWAFPRRVYFNGENCEMPLPDSFPMLPNGTSKQNYHRLHLLQWLLSLALLYLTTTTTTTYIPLILVIEWLVGEL